MTIALSQFDEVRLDRVSRDFGSLNALRDVSLTIRRREFIALLGPSGCGKSTALNCLAGLLPLTDGEILIDGERVDTLPPEDRGFGMVFQNYALFPHLSVRKNVAFGLQMRNVPKAEAARRVAEAIALVKLEQHADKLPGQLSGGQQQRVAIARAVVLQPRLVLMDEPLSNLDAKLRLDMRTEIRTLHQSLGLTTVYVTHDQEEALSLADRLVVLREGRVQQIGAPAELHDHPANWHVGDFMGYRNLVDMEVAAVEGTSAVVQRAGTSLRATTVGRVAAGEVVRVAVRPEDLVVTSPQVPVRSGNHLAARVSVVEYHGREFAVTALTEAGQVLHVHADRAPAVGSPVELTVDASRALAYPLDLDAAGAPAGAGRPLAEVHP